MVREQICMSSIPLNLFRFVLHEKVVYLGLCYVDTWKECLFHCCLVYVLQMLIILTLFLSYFILVNFLSICSISCWYGSCNELNVNLKNISSPRRSECNLIWIRNSVIGVLITERQIETKSQNKRLYENGSRDYCGVSLS